MATRSVFGIRFEDEDAIIVWEEIVGVLPMPVSDRGSVGDEG